MKFLCDNCKAKYQIPDEKVAGRTLRMQCRKCGHDILVRGSAESIAPSPASVASARPSPASIAAASPVPRTRGTGSHVGPAPAPVRAASAVPSALSADFRNKVQTHALGADESSNVPDELWHVAINDVPVGPIRREEIARKVGVGAVTGESLVWREGFDDWKPLREVAQLASLLRHLRAPPPAPGSGTDARPAPLGGRLGGAAAVEDHGFQDEATVVGESPYDSELAAPPAARAPAASTPARVAAAAPARVAPTASTPKRVAPESAAPASTAQRVAPAASAAPAPAATPAAERAAPAAVAAVAAVTPANDSLLPPAVSEPPAGLAPFAAAASPVAAAAPVVVAPAAPISVPPAAPAAERRRDRSPLPVGAMMGIAFAGMAGIGFAIVIASRMMQPATDASAGPSATTAPAESPAVVAQAPAPDVETDVGADVVPVDATATTPTPQKAATRPATGAHPVAAGAATRPASANGAPLSASERAMMARFAEESGGGPSQIDVGRAGPATTARPLDSQAISQVVTRNRLMLQRCYERASRGMAEAPTTRMDISLRVSPSGAVSSATVNGTDFGGLAACIQSTVSRWRFPESSGGGEARFPMVFQGGG